MPSRRVLGAPSRRECVVANIRGHTGPGRSIRPARTTFVTRTETVFTAYCQVHLLDVGRPGRLDRFRHCVVGPGTIPIGRTAPAFLSGSPGSRTPGAAASFACDVVETGCPFASVLRRHASTVGLTRSGDLVTDSDLGRSKSKPTSDVRLWPALLDPCCRRGNSLASSSIATAVAFRRANDLTVLTG